MLICQMLNRFNPEELPSTESHRRSIVRGLNTEDTESIEDTKRECAGLGFGRNQESPDRRLLGPIPQR